MKTINRAKLMRDVQAGKMEARLAYAYDGRTVRSTDWMPARVNDGDVFTGFIPEHINFTPYDFKYKSGYAGLVDDVIKMSAAGRSFELRYKVQA